MSLDLEEIKKNIKRSKELQKEGKELIDKIDNQELMVDKEAMLEDFKYIRDTLRDNTVSARAVLNKVTFQITSQETVEPFIIEAFSKLNDSLTNSMKLYSSTYNDIVNTLKKIKDLEPKAKKSGMSTNDIIDLDG